MSRPQVTITLGRSGQRVIKQSSDYDYASSSGQRLSGNKRSFADPFAANVSGSVLNKRLRGDASTQGSRYTGLADARIGKNDLRLKLLRKRVSNKVLESRESIQNEMQSKTSGMVQSAQQYERVHLADTSLPRRVPLELARSSHASQASDGLRPRSPNRVLNDSRYVSSPRNINEFQHVALRRPTDAPRNVHPMGSDLVNPLRSNGPPPAMLGAVKPFTVITDEESLTVKGLLNALGLGKYAIHFQAEEVDMAVLKQMSDRDLKELGIPMGPRKKILLAMLAINKKPKPPT